MDHWGLVCNRLNSNSDVGFRERRVGIKVASTTMKGPTLRNSQSAKTSRQGRWMVSYWISYRAGLDRNECATVRVVSTTVSPWGICLNSINDLHGVGRVSGATHTIHIRRRHQWSGTGAWSEGLCTLESSQRGNRCNLILDLRPRLGRRDTKPLSPDYLCGSITRDWSLLNLAHITPF